MLRIDFIMHFLQEGKLQQGYAVGKQQSQEWTQACLTLKLGFLADFATLFPMELEQRREESSFFEPRGTNVSKGTEAWHIFDHSVSHLLDVSLHAGSWG